MATATIHTVYCVLASTGTDTGVLQAVAGLADTVLPSEVGGQLLQGIQTLPSVISAIDFARNDPDDLYITLATSAGQENAIWPSPGNHGSVNSGQSVDLESSFDFGFSQNLSLWDWDNFSDDLLGSVTMFASEAGSGPVAKVARSQVEGSAYYVIYEVN